MYLSGASEGSGIVDGRKNSKSDFLNIILT
jgi:hypothetical protein